jgi:hypothetical protein
MKTEAAETFETLLNIYMRFYIKEDSEVHNYVLIIFIYLF